MEKEEKKIMNTLGIELLKPACSKNFQKELSLDKKRDRESERAEH